jgi:hypothetical protein
MKKIIFSLILGIFLGVSGIASASTVISIHVEWGYTPPTEPAVTGFRLYREGVPIADFVGADLTQSDCNLVIYSDFRPVQNFTLTATFADGTESPHSAPYPFSVEGHLHPLPTDGVERLTRNNPYPNLRYRGKGVKMIFLGDESGNRGGEISSLTLRVKRKV